MKTSAYNISVPLADNWVLVFNSFSKSFLCLTTTIWKRCFNEDSSVKMENLQTNDFETLRQNGFVIEDGVDEFADALSLRMKSRLNKRLYHIIVNPTLDCNLRCWYCYETHKTGSTISQENINAILKHIELKHLEDNFEALELSFFGGEPFLKASIISQLIEDVSNLCRSKNINLKISFTTNGTIMPPKILAVLKDKNVSFQITLDGNRDQHNLIRGFKTLNNTNSYDVIWKNIKKLYEHISQFHLCLRINFDRNTFVDHKQLAEQILSLGRNKLTVSLQKVWQVDSSSINYEDLFEFVNTLLDHNVNVRFLELSNGATTCYADRINSVVINYDGKVYKCTARDFNGSNSIGELLPTGDIIWDYTRLQQYSYSPVPLKCKKCKLFPSCMGTCSQSIIENGDDVPCIIKKPFTIEDYVLFSYKLKSMQKL